MIQSVRVYRTKGKQFEQFKAAVNYREDLIDEFLRKLPGYQDMPAKSRIAFMEGILSGRKVLLDLLDYNDVEREEYD